MNDCEKLTCWREGMMYAAKLLTIYPENANGGERVILDIKRREILAAAGNEETKPTNRRRLGDGVTAQMQGEELCLSAQNGDGSEDVLIMSREVCEGLARYMRQNVFCREGG